MKIDFFSLLHIIAVASITVVCLWILLRQRRIHRWLIASGGVDEGEDARLRRRSRQVFIVGLTALVLVLASRLTPLLVGSGEMESGHPGVSSDKEISAVEPGGDLIREIRVKIAPPPENASREVPAKPISPPESLEQPADPVGEPSAPQPTAVAEASVPKTAEPAAEASPAMPAALRFIADGDAAFTSPARIQGKGDWHRVFIGFYRNRQEAEVAAGLLKQRNYPYAMVLRQPYGVQVGLFESGEELARARSDLEKKGFLPYSIPESGSGKVRVLVGFFETAGEARRLKNDLEKEGILSQVVSR